MDPVSHGILGRAMVAALERHDRTRFGIAAGPAAVLGALSPDVDSVLMPVGWDIYLRAHEIGTHSLAGAILVGCGAAAVVRLFARGARYPALAAAAVVGALSHLLLDILSGARLHVFWPASDRRFVLPLVAMADPWLIAVLAAGALAIWWNRAEMRRSAIAVLAATAVFFAVKGAPYVRARHAAGTDPRTARGTPWAMEARWGSWTDWFLFERDADVLRVWQVDGWHGDLRLLMSQPVGPDSPLIAASRRLGTVRNFLAVHDLPFAIEQPAGEGQATVLWSDVRYCGAGAPGSQSISCGLWFGGRLRADGRPLMLLVRLGDWTQTRAASE